MIWKLVRKTSGEEVWLDLSNGQRVWRCLYPVWMLIKRWLQLRKSSVITYIGWPILWTVSFSPQPFLYCPMGPWTKCPWWQRCGLCMGSTTWTSIHQGCPGCSCCWLPDLPAAETNIEPQIEHHFLGRPASDLAAGWLLWTTSSVEGTVLCSYWSR